MEEINNTDILTTAMLTEGIFDFLDPWVEVKFGYVDVELEILKIVVHRSRLGFRRSLEILWDWIRIAKALSLMQPINPERQKQFGLMTVH